MEKSGWDKIKNEPRILQLAYGVSVYQDVSGTSVIIPIYFKVMPKGPVPMAGLYSLWFIPGAMDCF